MKEEEAGGRWRGRGRWDKMLLLLFCYLHDDISRDAMTKQFIQTTSRLQQPAPQTQHAWTIKCCGMQQHSDANTWQCPLLLLLVQMASWQYHHSILLLIFQSRTEDVIKQPNKVHERYFKCFAPQVLSEFAWKFKKIIVKHRWKLLKLCILETSFTGILRIVQTNCCENSHCCGNKLCVNTLYCGDTLCVNLWERSILWRQTLCEFVGAFHIVETNFVRVCGNIPHWHCGDKLLRKCSRTVKTNFSPASAHLVYPNKNNNKTFYFPVTKQICRKRRRTKVNSNWLCCHRV